MRNVLDKSCVENQTIISY